MTDSVTVGSDAYEQYVEAGDILTTVLSEAADRVTVGATHLEVASFAEERIRELGGEPAFPVNISVNEEASHAAPGADDDTEFGEDMVCLDVGVHVDGHIADAATTVDLSGTPELVEAAEESLAAAIDMVEPGVQTGALGAEIQDVVEAYGYNPVVNLTGHGMDVFDAHTGPTVPNRGVDSGAELAVGDVVAIEPFVTTGTGKVTEGAATEIYEVVSSGTVRDRRARQLLDDLEQFDGLPFAARWLDGARAEMSLTRLERADIVRSYPVLKEADGELVGQDEHTLIVTEDGCEVVTA
ncbi:MULTISPECIES: type II methionyl aminopeptidase [Halobacterium]|uniref:Methionine aminopeptidase n=4 Tax=Halobacterium salinarum TaxID=2242 RepID=Q9HP03_HALSA|nr:MULTISPECIES: type II methionyl aminopeptidase [Halobacterium]AAG20067.1 methionyl aminopeptidase [Halobacterium salinarum NRC-1]MBB6089077.1 methionyl aminopeptidase [Halobacterium salinarum]MCF2166136.1 type II methionyl aminopeptidase [Halobacterium salinarum]MCF2167619.1 type II methionyl aminopeptidase [Halobacterium salinarum]MCF2207294.1 type II methionyl aminopeptidase [Halobacterium salinarum]